MKHVLFIFTFLISTTSFGDVGVREIINKNQDKNIVFKVNDGGVETPVLELNSATPGVTIYSQASHGTGLKIQRSGHPTFSLIAGGTNALFFGIEPAGGGGFVNYQEVRESTLDTYFYGKPIIVGSGTRDIELTSTTSDARLVITGNKSTDTRFGQVLFQNSAGGSPDSVAGIEIHRDGANDAAKMYLQTQPTGGGLTNRMEILGNGRINVNNPTSTVGRFNVYDTAINPGNFHAQGNSGAGAAIFRLQDHVVSSSRSVIRLYSDATTDSDGNYFISFYKNGTDTIQGYIKGDTATTVAFASASDRRIKTSIKPVGSMLEKLNQLKVVDYNVKEKFGGHSDARVIGVVAQDAIKIFPSKVDKTDDGLGDEVPEGVEPWTVSRDFTFELIKAVQELSEINVKLQTKIDQLNERLESAGL